MGVAIARSRSYTSVSDGKRSAFVLFNLTWLSFRRLFRLCVTNQSVQARLRPGSGRALPGLPGGPEGDAQVPRRQRQQRRAKVVRGRRRHLRQRPADPGVLRKRKKQRVGVGGGLHGQDESVATHAPYTDRSYLCAAEVSRVMSASVSVGRGEDLVREARWNGGALDAWGGET